MRYAPRAVLVLLLLASLSPLASAEDAPMPRRGAMIKRLEARLASLELSAEQKQKTDQILADAATKLGKIPDDASLAELRDAAGEIFRETHARLAGVLTADQLRRFEQSIPRRIAEDSSDAPKPPPAPPTMTEGDPMMGESKPPEKTVEKPAASPAPTVPAPAPTPSGSALIEPRFAAGADAPGFTLKNLDSKPVSLNRLRGKPTVILFGSFTSPTFRDKAPVFDALKKEYRNKVNFLIVYTREAYPNNEWEVQRNIDDQIRVGQHTTIEERTRLARLTAEGMKLDTEVLVDEMDDAVAKAYDAMPNGCVIIDGQGKIVRKQKWADVHAAKLAIDEALRPR